MLFRRRKIVQRSPLQSLIEAEADRVIAKYQEVVDQRREREQSVVICGQCRAEIRPDTHANILAHIASHKNEVA